ncbi:MAG: PHP domain-containing protein [Methanoregulaceae archaeon]|nr:PHP domain-containing protein [Methanoregulaceae archaeon]
MSRTIRTGRVRFHPPAVDEIYASGLTPVDMHVHTCYSDSVVRVRDLLSYAEERGIGVAITDHNTVEGVREACTIGSCVPLIPGIEVSAGDGPHLLLYFFNPDDLFDFYTQHVKDYRRGNPFMAIGLSTEEILERASEFKCVKIAAHPFGYAILDRGVLKCIGKACLPEEVLLDLDGIEVICGALGRRLNDRAAIFAGRTDLGITGGSDGHRLAEVGSVLTCCRADSPGEFLDSILHRENIVIGSERGSLRKGMTAGIVVIKFLPYTIPSLRIHYEQSIPRIRRFLGKIMETQGRLR